MNSVDPDRAYTPSSDLSEGDSTSQTKRLLGGGESRSSERNELFTKLAFNGPALPLRDEDVAAAAFFADDFLSITAGEELGFFRSKGTTDGFEPRRGNGFFFFFDTLALSLDVLVHISASLPSVSTSLPLYATTSHLFFSFSLLFLGFGVFGPSTKLCAVPFAADGG